MSANPKSTIDRSIDEVEARHAADRHWFLSRPGLWIDRQQQVVAVLDSTILGQSPDFMEAYQDAVRASQEQGKPCPDKYDITYIVVPELFTP